MSDRTWNPIDARLYEEDWTQEAILIAACLIARCPNQYGIFEFPWGFLTRFFRGLYTRAQIETVISELAAGNDPFIKLYCDKKWVWIRKKWKREQKNPSWKNEKGALTFLKDYPMELARDFQALYKIEEGAYKGDAGGVSEKDKALTRGHISTDSDSDSDSDSDKKKDKKLKKDNGNISKSEERQITDCYQELYIERFKKKPPWSAKEGRRIQELLKSFNNNAERICQAIKNAFASEDRFLKENCGSFMTLTAAAVIGKADTLSDYKSFNKRLDDNSRFTETKDIL
jgi:hypothetical protein